MWWTSATFAANLASKGLSDLSQLLPSGAAGRYLPSVWQACPDLETGSITISSTSLSGSAW